jgi:hypothetical protein
MTWVRNLLYKKTKFLIIENITMTDPIFLLNFEQVWVRLVRTPLILCSLGSLVAHANLFIIIMIIIIIILCNSSSGGVSGCCVAEGRHGDQVNQGTRVDRRPCLVS